MSVSIRNLAAVAQHSGQPERAAHPLGASEAIREAIGSPLNPSTLPEYEQLVAQVRAALDEPDFAQAWAEGRALTLAQAVALARGLTPPGPRGPIISDFVGRA